MTTTKCKDIEVEYVDYPFWYRMKYHGEDVKPSILTTTAKMIEELK